MHHAKTCPNINQAKHVGYCPILGGSGALMGIYGDVCSMDWHGLTVRNCTSQAPGVGKVFENDSCGQVGRWGIFYHVSNALFDNLDAWNLLLRFRLILGLLLHPVLLSILHK